MTSIAVTLPVIRKGCDGPPPVKKSRGLFAFSSRLDRDAIAALDHWDVLQVLSNGLRAVGGQFLPPMLPGQMSVICLLRTGVASGL